MTPNIVRTSFGGADLLKQIGIEFSNLASDQICFQHNINSTDVVHRERLHLPLRLMIPARDLDAMVHIVGTSVVQAYKELTVTCVFPIETLRLMSPLWVVSGAIRGEFVGLLSTNPWPLVLSVASALVLLARISWPEVSKITLKTPNMKQ